MESSGISLTTTLPAPITQRLPMVTPGQTMTPAPSQQSSPMVMGKPVSTGLRRFHIIDGVVRGYQLAVRTYQGAVADGNPAFIEHRGAIVDEYILTHLDAVTMVAVEGWTDGG